jgi:hypothetical protein
VFVPGKHFQPNLVFVGKAGAYPSEAPFQVHHSCEGSWPGTNTLACYETFKLRLENFYSAGPWSLYHKTYCPWQAFPA